MSSRGDDAMDAPDPTMTHITARTPYVVITMPAYQAEQTLERTVSAIPPGVADELILVDDASRDATVDVARGLGLRVHVHPVNRGYGGNQKSCYSLALNSGADIVVLLHPDYQYEPKAVPLLIAPILAGDADMTFGSRFAGMGDPRAGGMPLYRYVGNRLTTIAQNSLLGSHFTEMHSGMRAYTRQALRSLPFLGYPEGFSFDAALLIDAVSSGLRVVEVPIPTRYTKESSSISIGRSVQYIADGCLFAARATRMRGRRGSRYLPHWRAIAARIPVDEPAPHGCPVCGHGTLRLRYPATASAQPSPAEFAPEMDRVGDHDDLLECRRCGSLSARPSWPVETVNHLYEASPVSVAEQGPRDPYFRWALGRIDSYEVPGRSMMEFGSSDGAFATMAQDAGWTVKGVEPSAAAVSAARARNGATVEQGFAEDVDLAPGSVDVVVMLETLEHLIDPALVLSRLRPAIARDGLLAVSLRGRGWRGTNVEGSSRQHLHALTPVAATVLMGCAGFDVVAADTPSTRRSSGDEALLIVRPNTR
jgi:SAM-dependent methyltransferase